MRIVWIMGFFGIMGIIYGIKRYVQNNSLLDLAVWAFIITSIIFWIRLTIKARTEQDG